MHGVSILYIRRDDDDTDKDDDEDDKDGEDDDADDDKLNAYRKCVYNRKPSYPWCGHLLHIQGHAATKHGTNVHRYAQCV